MEEGEGKVSPDTREQLTSNATKGKKRKEPEPGESTEDDQESKGRATKLPRPTVGEDSQPRNEEDAETLYKAALESLDAASAKFEPGKCRHSCRFVNSAIEHLKRAAEQGHCQSQAKLGDVYSEWTWVDPDWKLAREYYELAAQQGDHASLFGIGKLYDNGHGVKQDWKKAVEYYELAAEKGSSSAKNLLAKKFGNFEVVNEHLYKVFEWHMKLVEGDLTE